MPNSQETIEVLLVEDNPGDATLIDRYVRELSDGALARPVVTHVESLPAAADRLAEDSFDVVLLDLGLPDSNGIETLERLQERIEADDGLQSVAIVVLTGLKDDEVAVEAIQRGAQDYLVKDSIDANVLERAIRYAIERHEQELALRRQNERLDQFASVVSHDLRNPLSIAMGNVEVVRESTGEDAVEDAAATADDALERMDELIDDLLTIAREGRSVEEPVPVDLAAAARRTWETVDTAAMDLVVDADCTVLADDSRLQQLFENCYRNAREHAGEDATVTVGETADGAGFFVADDGPGIPPGDRDDVFDPGYSSRESGTGFGLNIVREIARAHDWTVSVTDADRPDTDADRPGRTEADGEAGGARFEFRDVDLV